MKKLLFLICIICSLSQVFAENEVYLDLNASEIHQIKTSKPELENNKTNISEDYSEEKEMTLHPFKYIKDELSNDLYSKQTITNKREKKIGKAKFGAKYDTTLAPESISQKRTLYSNYKLSDKMSVEADYQTNSMSGLDAQTKGTVGIGPEYKLNKKIKLKNKFSKNIGDNSNKGEISVEYKPFKDNRMDFSAGASQIQQDDGNSSHSQVNFGTNFRF